MRGLLASLLFLGLSQAANVYLSPADSFPSRLSPQQANLVVAAHLGLEQFDAVNQDTGRLDHLFRERDFVGKGGQNGLLLMVDEADAADIIPSAFQPSFSFPESQADSLSSLVETYNQRATHAYSYVYANPSVPTQGVPRILDIFSLPSPANKAFLAEMSTLANYLESPHADQFAALQLSGISKLASSYGRSSEQYRLATETLRTVIDAALADKSVRLALLTYNSSLRRRSPQLSEQSPFPVKIQQSPQPIRQLASSCLGSAGACANATNNCSGHGECVSTARAQEECFVCACRTTLSDTGKVQNWAGEMCERRDVSGPFVLITGTVITLILLMAGSVSLLHVIGSQELPSILTGGVNGGSRKE
ncbi:hypothetical protein F5I97DRAFT_787612 [Phlebopus sp. FC_14]|nr:hypothetical protein F5I97DRAFT_787612 [Phlebopus sp. FC_14]